MSYFTTIDATIYDLAGNLLQGTLHVFLPNSVLLPDGSLVMPFAMDFPIVDGKPYTDATKTSPVKLVATEAASPQKRIAVQIQDGNGNTLQAGDVLVPQSAAPVNLVQLLLGAEI